MHRYELGIEPYEVVEEEFGPVEGHTVPSAKKKQKVTHSGAAVRRRWHWHPDQFMTRI